MGDRLWVRCHRGGGRRGEVNPARALGVGGGSLLKEVATLASGGRKTWSVLLTDLQSSGFTWLQARLQVRLQARLQARLGPGGPQHPASPPSAARLGGGFVLRPVRSERWQDGRRPLQASPSSRRSARPPSAAISRLRPLRILEPVLESLAGVIGLSLELRVVQPQGTVI